MPWLKTELKGRGYDVWVPELPGNETPNRQIYNDFLFSKGWDFANNLVVGHSSGAVAVMNLLQDERCPPIKTAVLVSVWANTAKANLNHGGLTRERFKDLFPQDGLNLGMIKSKANHLLFIHSDNDPYCPLEQAEWLAKQTSSQIIVVSGGDHLNYKAGFSELPQLTKTLDKNGWL